VRDAILIILPIKQLKEISAIPYRIHLALEEQMHL